jgi:hypothetical protein
VLYQLSYLPLRMNVCEDNGGLEVCQRDVRNVSPIYTVAAEIAIRVANQGDRKIISRPWCLRSYSNPKRQRGVRAFANSLAGASGWCVWTRLRVN